MRYSALLLSALAIFGGAVSARGSGAPDARGISVIVLDDIFSSLAAQKARAALVRPGVDGMTLVAGWSSVEPAPGAYDWRTLDKWIDFADSLGKKITLVIKAGSSTPGWVFQPPPGGAGAAPLLFRISPHEGKTSVCDTETIAAPWDPMYLAAWDSLLSSLSSHLKSAGTYGAVTALRLTGINRTSDELRLPEETAQSTGLACVSDAIGTWQQAGYRPSKLLHAWDAVTDAFRNNFPDKIFSVAIIPNPPQVAFPPIAEDGTLLTGTLPDQNQPLLALAAAKYPGRLVVQFNFLLNGTPANFAVVGAAQTLGTMIAFQTNNFYSLSDSGAACGGTPANPVPCTASTFLPLLETGIYPLGQSFSLRPQYIEVWPIDANAFPADIQQAHQELFAAPPTPAASISLGEPKQLFHKDRPDALGMQGVPDMHTPLMRQSDGSYRLWIAGRFAGDSTEGATGLITTTDFLSYAPAGGGSTALPVMEPSCRPGSAACWNNFDADYAGADFLFRASNGKDLLMLYHGQTKYYGVRPPDRQTDPSWCEVGLARSTDNGATWTGRVPVVSGSDPKPATIPAAGIYGTVEPGAIVAGGYIYVMYACFPIPGAADAGPPTFQIARAPVASDGAPGSWTKYYDGSFGAQPGLGGLGSQVVPSTTGATRTAQPWLAWSSYLNAYVLVFIAREGWFFSLSTDLVTWSVPVKFFDEPGGEFADKGQTDENVIFVTPGNDEGVIGRSGYVLYASTPSWGSVPHELWMRTFTFDAPATGVPDNAPVAPAAYALQQNYPNPFNPSTTIRYILPQRSHVTLTLFNALGRKVAVLADDVAEAGAHEVSFAGEGLPAGVYFCRMQAGDFLATKKLALVR